MQKFKKLIGYCLSVASVGVTAFFSALLPDPTSPYYSSLSLPVFTPQPLVFTCAFAFIYVCFVVLLGETVANRDMRKECVLTFALLLLNVGWCAVFFLAKIPYLALAVLATQLVIIGYETIRYTKCGRKEWVTLIPISAWYMFLFILNYGIVIMN